MRPDIERDVAEIQREQERTPNASRCWSLVNEKLNHTLDEKKRQALQRLLSAIGYVEDGGKDLSPEAVKEVEAMLKDQA